ncbi:hypothetical protein F4861DRAFT_384378 [Xylaria intraflava]|nr:hypothetical protein F4861DRAFT_384378 [Xylaria intraflava]
MGDQDKRSGAQKARDSLASILSYYENHVPADKAPDFVKRISSGEIQVWVRKGDIPSAEQGEIARDALQEALKTKDAIDNLSTAEKDLMNQAAQISIQRRKLNRGK